MTLQTLLRTEIRRQRRPFLVSAAAAAVTGASMAALLGLSGAFITGAALAGAGGTALAFNYMLPAAAIRLLAVSRTGGRYVERLEGHRAALNAGARVRPALFEALTGSPAASALPLSVGEAASRLVQDVDALENALVRRSAPWNAGGAAVAGVLLATLAGPLAGAATLSAFMLTAHGGRRLGRGARRRAGAELQTAAGRLKDTFAALAAAAPELRAYDLEDWAAEQVAEAAKGLLNARTRLTRAAGLQAGFSALLAPATATLVLLLGREAPAPIAALAALASAAALEGAAGLGRSGVETDRESAAHARLAEVLDGAGGPRPSARPEHARIAVGPPGALALELAPGARLGLVGRSDCGKSSALEQLIGLREPPAGRFRVGGRDVAELEPAALRAMFAYAPQDAALLAGAVRDNLRIGDPPADDARLWEALEDAALASRVAAMPQGLDTWIGDGGERLSGGERRRLSLARALLRPAPWLILDEPTEGLDRTTEARVVERLAARLDSTGQGLILVSHRPAPLGLCTRVLDFDAGRHEQAA